MKSQVTVTLDSDLIQTINKLAQEDDRSFSNTVNRLLRKSLKENGISSPLSSDTKNN